MCKQKTQVHSFQRLILRDDVYSDATQITDENGFCIIDVPRTAILLNYSKLLKISHWAHDNRAHSELTQEQQHENARRIVACVNACTGLTTENLEDNKPLKDGLHGLNQGIRDTKAQRDELAALLRDISGMLQTADPLKERILEALVKASG